MIMLVLYSINYLPPRSPHSHTAQQGTAPVALQRMHQNAAQHGRHRQSHFRVPEGLGGGVREVSRKSEMRQVRGYQRGVLSGKQ